MGAPVHVEEIPPDTETLFHSLLWNMNIAHIGGIVR